MRKVVAEISDLDGLQISSSGRELAQQEALVNVGILREVNNAEEHHSAHGSKFQDSTATGEA